MASNQTNEATLSGQSSSASQAASDRPCPETWCALPAGHECGHDGMGYTQESLLQWMLEHAEQRTENAGPRAKTVPMKFARDALRTWTGRVRDVLETPRD